MGLFPPFFVYLLFGDSHIPIDLYSNLPISHGNFTAIGLLFSIIRQSTGSPLSSFDPILSSVRPENETFVLCIDVYIIDL
jgi:hypothetical protein